MGAIVPGVTTAADYSHARIARVTEVRRIPLGRHRFPTQAIEPSRSGEVEGTLRAPRHNSRRRDCALRLRPSLRSALAV